MRISKSTKTDVKASIDTEFSSRLGDALRNALIDAGFSKRKAENMGITELLNACHEVGINCDPYIIKAREASSLSSKTDVKASSNYKLWSEDQLRSKMLEIGFNPNGLSKAEMIADLEQYDADTPKESTDASSCNASISTDKALQHIKAAIDILGKSGQKDDVTRDSIANLGVVLFDLKSKN